MYNNTILFRLNRDGLYNDTVGHRLQFLSYNIIMFDNATAAVVVNGQSNVVPLACVLRVHIAIADAL